MTNADLRSRREAAVARGVASATGVYAERADNAELWDVEGRRYIDFASGIAVLNTGHRHPLVTERALEQANRFTHTSFQVVPYEAYVALAEKLNALAPGQFAKKTLLVTTGAEAVENACKIARAATGRTGVVALTAGYHGRTMFTLGLTGKVVPYKAGFGPFPTDIFRAPCPSRMLGIGTEEALAHLELLFKTDAEPARVAAIIVEPELGEGGYQPLPFDYLEALRRICDRHGILLIADEVQTGFGRTGRWFAIEHSGVVPDLITVAKGLAGGWPLAGVIGRAEVMDAVPPGGLGGTYGGNPVACAAALGVIEAIEREGLLERAERLGARMKERLAAMEANAPRPVIGEIRGLGPMIAVEFVRDTRSLEPDPDLARAVVAEALQRGLILLTCGMYGNVLRLMIPLTIPEAVLEEGLDILETSLAAATTRAA